MTASDVVAIGGSTSQERTFGLVSPQSVEVSMCGADGMLGLAMLDGDLVTARVFCTASAIPLAKFLILQASTPPR